MNEKPSEIRPKEGELWTKVLNGEKTYWVILGGIEDKLVKGSLELINTQKFPLQIINATSSVIHLRGVLKTYAKEPVGDIVHGKDGWEKLWDLNMPPKGKYK